MMSSSLKSKIYNYWISELERYWEKMISNSYDHSSKPFHYALAPKASQAWFRASERSFSTTSGSWWENICLWIAEEYHTSAKLKYKVTGELSPAAESHISQILENMDKGNPRRVPNRVQDIGEVLTVQQQGTGSYREIVSDLYFKTTSDEHVFIELKTPGPNKTTSKELKQKILTISALMKGDNCRAIAASAYNPDGDSEYAPQFLPQFCELGTDHLVGKELWDLVGEKGTYEEVLGIAKQVGKSPSNMEGLFFKN